MPERKHLGLLKMVRGHFKNHGDTPSQIKRLRWKIANVLGMNKPLSASDENFVIKIIQEGREFAKETAQ